jgi:hypothetical protein
MRRIVSVVAQPQSYRNLAYLLLGLPLGTLWLTVLVSGVAVGVSLLVVALIGIPILVGLWYVTRWCANVERAVANALLGQSLDRVPMRAPALGNLWARLRTMSGERDRGRELGFLMLRFPVGIVTFTAAVTTIATPLLVAYAPFVARYDDEPFGDWALSSRMENVATSSWAWLLVPLGIALLIPAFHALNALARGCGRWTAAALADSVGS